MVMSGAAVLDLRSFCVRSARSAPERGQRPLPSGCPKVAKTEAGVRRVNMTPWVLDEVLAYRATRPDAEPDEPAFPTRSGTRRGRF